MAKRPITKMPPSAYDEIVCSRCKMKVKVRKSGGMLEPHQNCSRCGVKFS